MEIAIRVGNIVIQKILYLLTELGSASIPRIPPLVGLQFRKWKIIGNFHFVFFLNIHSYK